MLAAANVAKACQMDFEPVGGVFGFGVDTVRASVAGGGINAYWVPYLNGGGLPGFADVPRLNPASPYIFTIAMNGCAFVVADSPLGAGYIRVYHHQHPNDQNVWNLLNAATPNVHSMMGYGEYGAHNAIPGGRNPVAFNFLYYRNSTWNYVTQPQSFNPHSNSPARRLAGHEQLVSVF